MRLRRFEAATVTEALARVRADLGPDAVILHARAPEPGASQGRVEVLAAVDDVAVTESRPARPETTPSREGDDRQPLGFARESPATPRVSRAVELEDRGETDRMEEMYRMLLELREGQAPTPRMPLALRPLYREMCRRELPGGLVRRLLLNLPAEVRLGRGGTVRPSVQAALAGAFHVQGLPRPGRQPRIIALVGPTGVGKTTTIAKLAGQCRQRDGMSVALMSLDTYRIGATAQMQIYAELLGAPLHVVRSSEEIARAVRAESSADLVLVDSMGRSPQHREGIADLQSLLRQIPTAEVHLVVSATTKGSDLEDIVRRFQPLQYQHVVITKLDEARFPGPILGLALNRKLSISYLATGQEVPNDLEPATPDRLATYLLPSGPTNRHPAPARG